MHDKFVSGSKILKGDVWRTIIYIDQLKFLLFFFHLNFIYDIAFISCDSNNWLISYTVIANFRNYSGSEAVQAIMTHTRRLATIIWKVKWWKFNHISTKFRYCISTCWVVYRTEQNQNNYFKSESRTDTYDIIITTRESPERYANEHHQIVKV